MYCEETPTCDHILVTGMSEVTSQRRRIGGEIRTKVSHDGWREIDCEQQKDRLGEDDYVERLCL